MNKLTNVEQWDLPQSPSFFNKLGHHLGAAFLFAKKKAKSKYIEVTEGINHKIEAEEALLRQEVENMLFEQSLEYEEEMKLCRKRWILYAFLSSVLSFIAGLVAMFFII